MKFGFVGPSYTDGSNVVSDEECINFFAETIETPGAQTRWVYFGTPGLGVFTTFADGPVRGVSEEILGRMFAVSGSLLIEVFADGTQNPIGDVSNDNLQVSIAASNIQLLVVSDGRAFCFTFATNAFVEVTASLAGPAKECQYSDGYFIVFIKDSNKFQMSDILDGTSWPGLQVNAVSVFPENIAGILVSHRELWVFGSQHIQPYQNTGTDEIFDVIPGTLIEKGLAATYGKARLDNTVFWIHQDSRGGYQAWRANGYTPSRISTHAVETALSSYPADAVANLVSYTYQADGHEFWVLYIPGTDCSWVYDVAESLWHKRAEWNEATATYGPHRSWNHTFAFGMHLVGDWKTGNLYKIGLDFLDDSGLNIRRVRRSPTLVDEMEWIYHNHMIVDFSTGLGPQTPLIDGEGNPRPPQAMLRFSDNRGSTWSNEQVRNCGFAGQFNVRVIWWRLGRSRYRVYEVVVSDPIPWVLVSAYLKAD